MERIIPEYYHRFRCIASACPDSCCKEWAVDVDADAAARYRALPGPLGDRLRRVLSDTDDGTVMEIENGRCPMWRKDGLCEIQAELGHDALCRVCREFPRLRHDYGGFVEYGLELSCPEAARLILTADCNAVSVTDVPGGEPADDPDALAILRRTREEALAFVEAGDRPLPHVLAVLLLYGHDVQAELDGGMPAALEPKALMDEAVKYAKSGDITLIFHFFRNLEILTPQWRCLLDTCLTQPVWPGEMRRFVQYLLRRYWLQAVADYDLLGRVKFILAACLLLSRIPGDILRTAQLFSKEIENDPENVEALLDGGYADPAFTDIQLLSLLLSP